MRALARATVAAALPLLACGGAALAEDHATGRNLPEMKFVTFPGLPKCGLNSVLNGDPAKTPSTILAKIESGCIVPWHWHTPNEELMMVHGTAQIETRDGSKPFLLKPGGYAKLPPRHVHQFRCVKECLMYVHADGAFDIHYVDRQGREMAPEAALKRTQKAASAR
jgi:quercetin dioxygenase-like cupin family protein